MTGRGIVTLTAAGAIDATYRVASFTRGGLTRSRDYLREVSGKGVNVSAVLALAGVPTIAVVVMGADDLGLVAASPHAAILRPVAVPGATRTNTSIVDDGGATTKVNAPAPVLSADAWDRAVRATITALEELDAGWLVLSGIVPPLEAGGAPADTTPLVAIARERGVRIAVDTSGDALARCAASPAAYALLKPNTHELAEVTRRSLRTVGDVIAAAREICARGAETVYVSMGADGALVVTARVAVHAHATPRRLANTAGAGDASLAGFLAGLSGWGAAVLDADAALFLAAEAAASWGAHSVAQDSTIPADLTDLPVARVTPDPDPAATLSDPAAIE